MYERGVTQCAKMLHSVSDGKNFFRGGTNRDGCHRQMKSSKVSSKKAGKGGGRAGFDTGQDTSKRAASARRGRALDDLEWRRAFFSRLAELSDKGGKGKMRAQ